MFRKNAVDRKEAREHFQGLNLGDWKERRSPAGSRRGGQATVLAVEHTNGTKGAFRYLRSDRPEAGQRFRRELAILTDPQFQHPNILRIIDYPRDREGLWYISEWGESFPAYWEAQAKRYCEDPESLVRLAVDVILQMLDGLSPLHEQGVVHRDIKPDNIIMKPGAECCPVLIDFGLAYAAVEEDRLTPMDDAVGNTRYSRDVMMDRMDEINPWLDVFQVSQLLIYMISEKPAKDWPRPRDWRWVNYSEELPNDLVLAIRALTALCSEEVTSPKSAEELSALIRELIVFAAEEEPEVGLDLDQIRKGISKGESIRAMTIADDIKVINSSYMLASQVYRRLRDKLEGIWAELMHVPIPVVKDNDKDFDSFYQTLIESPRSKSSTLYRLQIGDQTPHFYVRIVCVVYRPSMQPDTGNPPLPESSNVFAFAVQRHGESGQHPRRLQWLTIERTGEWVLRDERMQNPEPTDAHQIGTMIKSWISDSEIWEAMHRDRR